MNLLLKNFQVSIPRIISVEGSIGAGKSSLLGELQNYISKENRTDIIILREPVEEWESVRDVDGNSILWLFYSDPVKYALAFQTLVCTTMVSALRAAAQNNPECRIIICERSLAVSRYVFAKMLHDTQQFGGEVQYNIYCRTFDELAELYNVHDIIFMNCSPKVCHERIIRRSRQGEAGVSLDYLERLEKYYLDWLHNMKVPILNIDVNIEVKYGSIDVSRTWIDNVLAFIDK
jgi:deoxyadenosine/deoxycytidine kinase